MAQVKKDNKVADGASEPLPEMGKHLIDTEFAQAEYTPEHIKLRAERQARRTELKQYRQRIEELPMAKDMGAPHYEIPGR